MRPALIGVVSGVAGFAAGALAYGWFAAHTLDTWQEVLRIEFGTEQELRAARAEREGDLLAALHHRWNTVDARSSQWVQTYLDRETPAPWFAVEFIILEQIGRAADPEGKGGRVAQGVARGQLARLLEANGHTARAAGEWKRAAELTGQSDLERLRALIASLRAQQDTELQRQAEDVVLGPAREGR